MRQITCSGTPFEIGEQHGRQASAELRRGLKFYQEYFLEMSKMEWETAKLTALKFLPLLQPDWSDYVHEMKGIATGAGVSFADILAMNVRSEISMGMMNDGCTALSWKDGENSFLAQNWDWDVRQLHNLIALKITQKGKPTITQITEAGIIGKIGLNSSGVGACLNAIRVKGVDFTKLPTHIALRIALDSTCLSQAVEILRKYGVASACHILLADPTGGIGLEFSHLDLLKIEMENGIVCHSNHFLIPHHPDVNEAVFLPDSKYRIKRVWELVLAAKEKGKGEGKLVFEEIGRILEDEGNYPGAINRGKVVETNSETLFSIFMDLREKKARVRHGRPTEALEEFELCPV